MFKYYTFASLIFTFGCNYSAPNNPNATSSNSGTQTIEQIPSGTITSYQVIATDIITPKCLGCHSSGAGNEGGINLETYSNVQNHLASISSAITSGSMPKRISPLTTKEKEIFLTWIDAGGPLNPSQISTPTPTPTAQLPIPTPPLNRIDYKMINNQILAQRCTSCHSDNGGNQAGINLETYEAVFNERTAIKNQIVKGSMPLPRSNPLTTQQKQIILDWLNHGAPENLP